jgi:hypothetical protein
MAKLGLLWIGIAISLVGAAGFMYAAIKFSHLAATKGPVFSEADVPPLSDNAKRFIPLEAGTAAMITLGIGVAAIGFSDKFKRKIDKQT